VGREQGACHYDIGLTEAEVFDLVAFLRAQ